MNFSTVPPNRSISRWTRGRYAASVSRTSSGSARSNRAVESTRSQNSTVTTRRSSRSSDGVSRPDRDQREVYDELVGRVLERVRRGRTVCMVTYGHPAVFDDSCHEALRRARDEGFGAELLPAVSAMDCLFADLEIDPGRGGLQLYEATDFLESARRPETVVPLILWQISVVGGTRTTGTVERQGLRRLADRLAELYHAAHEVIVYEASPFPIGRPLIERTRVEDLAKAPVTGLASLYVPPSVPSS